MWQESAMVDLEQLKEAATIYQLKDKSNPLFKYHSELYNNAAYEIVKENPSLAIAGNKARLLELARNKLDIEGYNYKKG